MVTQSTTRCAKHYTDGRPAGNSSPSGCPLKGDKRQGGGAHT